MGIFNKKELAKINKLENEISNYKNQLEKLGALEYSEIQKNIDNAKKELESLNQEIITKNNSINNLDVEIKEKKLMIDDLTDEVIYQEFGFYRPKYDCMSSTEYAEKIKEIRTKQKNLVKDKKALSFSTEWTLDGSKAKGRAMNNDNMKMVLRAFNNECDVLISKVKFNNVERIEDRIKKVALQIDKLNTRNKISILQSYIDLKIEELHLVHEHAVKKTRGKRNSS